MKSEIRPARLKWPVMLLIVISIATPTVSWAALNAYLKIWVDTEETALMIQGDVTLSGREGSIEVNSFGHNVNVLFDSASGLPIGKRQHRPIRILKPVDKSTPELWGALIQNRVLPHVVIEFWRPNQAGVETHYYSVELLNAEVVSIIPNQASFGEDAAYPLRESVSLYYQKVAIIWEATGSAAEDDWTTPVQ